MIESDRELSAMVQELWDNDVNRLTPGKDYRISLQVSGAAGGKLGEAGAVSLVSTSSRRRAKPGTARPSTTTTTTTERALLCSRLWTRTFSRRRHFWVGEHGRAVGHKSLPRLFSSARNLLTNRDRLREHRSGGVHWTTLTHKRRLVI